MYKGSWGGVSQYLAGNRKQLEIYTLYLGVSSMQIEIDKVGRFELTEIKITSVEVLMKSENSDCE